MSGDFTGWRDIYGRPSDEPATKAAEWRETHRRLRSAYLARVSTGWWLVVVEKLTVDPEGAVTGETTFPTLAEAWAFLERECATFGVALEVGE